MSKLDQLKSVLKVEQPYISIEVAENGEFIPNGILTPVNFALCFNSAFRAGLLEEIRELEERCGECSYDQASCS